MPAMFDTIAIRKLYDDHGAACVGLAARVIGDRSRAEDVVQEVFVSLWLDPDRYRAGRGTMRSYLLACVHNRAVDIVRAERARGTREARYVDARGFVCAAPEVEVLRTFRDQEVQRALAVLTNDQRVAVSLAYLDGYSYREVARVLGQPEGTVKSRIRAGLDRLRNELRRDLVAA